MSPRTGRPTDDPKDLSVRIRLSEKDRNKLDYCALALGIPKAMVIRQGIQEVYEKLNK